MDLQSSEISAAASWLGKNYIFSKIVLLTRETTAGLQIFGNCVADVESIREKIIGFFRLGYVSRVTRIPSTTRLGGCQ